MGINYSISSVVTELTNKFYTELVLNINSSLCRFIHEKLTNNSIDIIRTNQQWNNGVINKNVCNIVKDTSNSPLLLTSYLWYRSYWCRLFIQRHDETWYYHSWGVTHVIIGKGTCNPKDSIFNPLLAICKNAISVLMFSKILQLWTFTPNQTFQEILSSNASNQN